MPRKLKSQDGNPYEIIRGMWEGAYVSHFLRLFRKKFGFNCLTTQDLEEALVDDESVALADIFARLLRYVTGNTDILIANFDSFLKKILIKERAEVPRFVESTITWHELAPEEKLGALKWLIDHVYQEKEEDIADYLDENYTADDLRGICAGQDAFNNVYWYLDDLRLYREFSHKKQSKKDWECVCLTLSDWHSFIKQFRKTSNVQEKELYTYLNFELFPFVEPELLNNGKKAQRSKEEVNKYLINQEREDLEVMLEKKTFLDCNNSTVKTDVNGTDTLCHEKLNGTSASTNSTENDITDFLVKTEDKSSNMNLCDGHLNISESICSISNSLSSTMDIKTSSVTNMCSSSCLTTCGSSQEAPVVTSSVSSSCSSGLNCSSSTVSTTTTAAAVPSREGVQDVNLQQPLSDIPSDSSSVASNKENAPPSSGNTGNDIPPMSAMSNMVGSTSTPATTASVQPLPSNMVNKTSFQMETQYMQQHMLFVFSTALANKAAESYLSGDFPSIVAFHCAQPGTKSFLEKYPLKVQQFNRQNPAAWLNSLAQMKQSGGRQMKNSVNQYFPGPHNLNNRFPGPSAGPISSPCAGACNMHGPGMCSAPRGSSSWSGGCAAPGMPPIPNDMCPQAWSAQQFGPGMSSPSSMNHRFPGPMPQGLVRQMGPSGNPLMGCMGNVNPNVSGGNSFPPNPGLNMLPMNQGPGGPSSLIGSVKVPDENLTPQQRQHREEQLAMIRKMQQLLFPEQQMDQAQGGMGSNMGPVMGGMPPQQQSRFGSGEYCVHPGMDVCFSPHQPCMNDHEHPPHPPDMYMESQMGGPGFPQHTYPPVSVSAQLEWQKLQHQFFEERRKKQGCVNPSLTQPSPGPQGQSQTPVPQQTAQPGQTQQSMSQPQTPQQPPPSLNSPSPGNRIHGPPPPYHQTNRRAMLSPHPASPNTSSLSLPSPRMASGLPSPADTSRQFPIPTPPGPRLSHPSPGSATPAGSNSLHTTPLNSPKPLNTSGPGSNSGTLIRTPTTPSNTASTPNGTPTSSSAPVLPNSAPATPAGSCTSSRKQSQSSTDVQDSNSAGISTSSSSDFSGPIPISTPNTVQGDLFYHNMHSCSQSSQKQEQCASQSSACQKEPSLMPVPSPQQIQYLNTFDGQELTIQKQPNTSIRELDIMSPTSMPPSMVMSGGSHSQFQSPDATSFPNTPGSCPSALENSQDSLAGRYPSSAPASMEGGIQRFTAPSPQMTGFDSGPRHIVPSSQMGDNAMQRFPMTQNMDMMRVPGPNSLAPNSLDDGVNRFAGPVSQGQGFSSGPNTNMNIARFPGSASEAMQRFRGPSPHTNLDMVHSRFMGSSPHVPCVDNISQSSQFSLGSETMTPVQSQSFPSSGSSITSQSSPCIGNTFIDNVSHSHLQNLQKMTPPFDNMSTNKISPDVISPMGQCSNSSVNSSNNMSLPSYGGTSPLTSTSQVGPSQRLTHFDPIASMAAMSESTVPLATSGGTAQTHQNINASNMNMSNLPIAGSSASNNPANMVNFHTNMQSMQSVIPSSVGCSMSNQNQFSMHNQMAPNAGCGPQTVNNTYVNATMSIQQLNIQNVVTTASYNAGSQGTNMNPHSVHPNCQGSGANTISCSVTTNHPIMHTAVTTRTSNSNMVLPGPRHGPPNFPGQPQNQRNISPVGAGSPSMMARGTPFNSTNIQMKANAPNTIQYLPARQQNAAPLSNRPASLEFLQRYAAPLTNLDSKVPTHNLQYFPSNGGSNPPNVHNNVGMNPGAGTMAPNMMNNQRPVNMMMGPMMRGATSNVSHPSGQMFPVGSGLPGAESPMFGRPPCPSVNNQMIPMNAMGGSQGVGMFPNKQMPLPMGGMTPDATQPLPPSMGQSFNYKQSPFYGPTTADPNYAVQFHNFQQQLYATNTRGSQISSQANMSGQGFFGHK